GYSRMVAEDEEATLRTLGAYRSTVVNLISEHGGRTLSTAGDSVVAEFASELAGAGHPKMALTGTYLEEHYDVLLKGWHTTGPHRASFQGVLAMAIDAASPIGSMEGKGFYNRNSSMQAAGIEVVLPFWNEAARAIPFGDEPLVIADYGASQGRNSMVPM